jgi:hypothetical protein
MRSKELQAYCKQYGERILSSIRPSFANLDIFKTIVMKQRMLNYPCGRELFGLQYELSRNQDLNVCFTFILLVFY